MSETEALETHLQDARGAPDCRHRPGQTEAGAVGVGIEEEGCDAHARQAAARPIAEPDARADGQHRGNTRTDRVRTCVSGAPEGGAR